MVRYCKIVSKEKYDRWISNINKAKARREVGYNIFNASPPYSYIYFTDTTGRKEAVGDLMPLCKKRLYYYDSPYHGKYLWCYMPNGNEHKLIIHYSEELVNNIFDIPNGGEEWIFWINNE